MLPQDQEKSQEKTRYLEFMAAFNLARELSKNQS
jgi:hypothetical protein